ncbi:MAG TPA: hypothetical protein VGL93_30320 [Streptosporangiaceae bacterium]
MNMPVLVDWLSLLLAPVIVIAAVIALTARRAAVRAGEPVPVRANVANAVAAVCALLLAALWMVWDH